MENLTNIFNLFASQAGPIGSTIIVIILLILYFLYKTNNNLLKTTSKTTDAVQSVDSNIKILSETVSDLNKTNTDVILGLSNNNNEIVDKIVTRLTETQKNAKAIESYKHDYYYNRRLDGASVIKENLYDILNITGADLVVLTELHNGSYNISGIPFVSYNITEQTTSRNSSVLTCSLENRPISEYSLIYKEVINDKDNLFWGNAGEISIDIDNQITEKLKIIGKSSMICIGVFNRFNKLFAFINIFYNNKRLTKDFIDNLNINRQKILIANKIDVKE
jgi:hypothetical protein